MKYIIEALEEALRVKQEQIEQLREEHFEMSDEIDHLKMLNEALREENRELHEKIKREG